MSSKFKKMRNIINLYLRYFYSKKLSSNKYSNFYKKEYKKKTGKNLDLQHPVKYTEKVQYAKLYLNEPLKTRLSDKYHVRPWVEQKIGSEYLVPLLGVWDKFSDINFNSLPKRFVLKTTHAASWNLIINNKETINYKKAKLKFDKWLHLNYAFFGDIELQYKDIKPKIVAEEFLQDSKGELKEYKFFCFDGKPYYCWFLLETEDQRYGNVYDLDWNIQPWFFEGRENTPQAIEKPENFDDMVDIAAELSKNFSHVRVDLYNVDGNIYFGEMTFTSAGGYRLIIPEKYNKMVGDLWNLDHISDI